MPSPSPSPSAGAAPSGPTPPPAVAQMPDWQTYRSVERGFTFLYPPACALVEQGDSVAVGSRIELTAMDAEGLTLPAYVDRLLAIKMQTNDWRLESRHTELVGGQQAVRIEYRFGGMGRYGSAVFVQRSGKVYVWQLTAGGFSCDEPAVFADIVSSFKFVP